MIEAWILVAVVGAATVVFKGAGALLLANRPVPPTFGRMVVLLAPGLLAALIVVQIFGEGRAVTFDARALGLAAAATALFVRAHVLVVVAAAAMVTAAARAAGLA